MNQNYIDGRWADARSERRYPVADLQNADRVLGEFPVSDERDAVAAIASGRRGFEEWKRTAYRDRVDMVASLTRSLEASADTLRATLVQATGKTRAEAQAEFESTLWFLRELPGVGSDFEGAMPPFPKLAVRFRGPLGLCVLQPGSLYPLFDLACFAAASFMWGNTSVVLPGPSAAAVADALADMVDKGPHVPGTFHLLDGATPKLTQLLRDHPDVAQFVSGQDGSFEVGKDFKPSEAAQSGALVVDDADLTRATGAVVRGASLANGQHPMSLHRIVVHRRVVSEFQSRLSEAVRALRVGDPSDPTVEIGPLLTPGRAKEMQKRVQKAVKEGAQILCGGSSPGGELKRGSFFEPTV
ncbi:MAG: aldehyde dehydrogenase family protein, partial [Candidatus Eisenbacteria bacterium]|nr:aldehyde dehydrogenase family protein [Candidatus Eisenbacteria bacterium]